MINADKPWLWKEDIAASVDMFNDWFVQFAPATYRESRARTTNQVRLALEWTQHLVLIEPQALKDHPEMLPTLRMCTAPPLARDRLVGLAHANKNLVEKMEIGQLPPRISTRRLQSNLERICQVIHQLLDVDIFPWLEENHQPDEAELYRASTVVADRLCGAVANPIIRNAQERRQLQRIAEWLVARGYQETPYPTGQPIKEMRPGTFCFHLTVRVQSDGGEPINMPIDVVIQPHRPRQTGIPTLIEAKSAGDFTNTNKRRKEEATKIRQLRATFGPETLLVLFLCGYFDSGYLGYEAAEGLDWVWEHRIGDLAQAGL